MNTHTPPPNPGPINEIAWVAADDLNGNVWNPNVVFNRELTLLERNLLALGWVQPLLVNPSGIIIDGFHRWRLSMDSKKVRERWGGLVPVSIIDVADDQAMVLTIRMNRAKGTHVAVRMARIVKALIDDHGWSREEVAAEIGAGKDEVDALYQEDVFTAKGIKDYRYSKAWVPIETRNEKAG